MKAAETLKGTGSALKKKREVAPQKSVEEDKQGKEFGDGDKRGAPKRNVMKQDRLWFHQERRSFQTQEQPREKGNDKEPRFLNGLKIL